MIKGDRFKLLGHTMEVMVRKESLDFVRYDLMCTCCSYPRNLVIQASEKDIELMRENEEKI